MFGLKTDEVFLVRFLLVPCLDTGMKTFLQFHESVQQFNEAAVDDATIKSFKKKMDEIKKMIADVEDPKTKQTMQSYYYSFYSGVRAALMQSKYAEVWPEENPTW